MDLKAFNTAQEIIACKNPMVSHWVIAVDIGFSGVKGMSPNKRFCFPSYVKQIESNLMSVDEEDIYYRDEEGLYMIGTKAQDLVRALMILTIQILRLTETDILQRNSSFLPGRL